ncbi:hypothetical protein [Deinococcus peraridilitoris]|uniref:Uncharacterized protein n=1 Tax=Deinococcus peraridilitoris (strain DSM 19664 / LMG 22246 / CIP 109416 / KR-200) TaxID=937777 RepID=L0A1V6_DEIPD|nr:hypothetical protein [Deinococcus peraridilitoris]AFZ66995.1 hypothetical protein Deipe_1454 [Deinococcus peraridilitoris DSM 19664]
MSAVIALRKKRATGGATFAPQDNALGFRTSRGSDFSAFMRASAAKWDAVGGVYARLPVSLNFTQNEANPLLFTSTYTRASGAWE